MRKQWIDGSRYLVETDAGSNGGDSGGSSSFSNIYSSEEVRIGTWFDKPLYRRVIEMTTPSSSGWKSVYDKIENAIVRDLRAKIYISENYFTPLPFPSSSGINTIRYNGADAAISGVPIGVAMYIGASDCFNKPCTVTLEYTKTTD